MSRYNRRATSVRWEYSGGLGMSLGPSEGNLTVGPSNYWNAQVQAIYDRDAWDGFTKGQDLVHDITITAQMRNQAISSAAQARLYDFLHKTAGSYFADAVSYSTDYEACFRVVVTWAGNGETSGLVYPRCIGTMAPADGQPFNTWAIAIQNFTAPVVWTGTPPAA